MEEQRKSENALVPALRFEGFSDPWEQRKFLELVERRSRFSNDPALPRVEYEDIVSGQGMLNKDVIEKHDKRGGIAFEPGDVLYGKLRPYLQNWLNPQFKGIALGDFWVLNPTDISSGFLFVLIRTPTFERVANESTGTKMPRADWQNVSNTEFLFRSVKRSRKPSAPSSRSSTRSSPFISVSESRRAYRSKPPSKTNRLKRLSARMRTLNAGIGAPSRAEKYSRARAVSRLSINLSNRPNSLRLSSSAPATSSSDRIAASTPSRLLARPIWTFLA